MVEFVAVLPAIHHDDTLRCVNSMATELRDRLVIVDNGANLRGVYCNNQYTLKNGVGEIVNAGVPAAWNIGLRHARIASADYLLIVSHSIEFGDSGGLDLIDQLDRSPAHGCGTQFGWKLVAVGRLCWQTIGDFDGVFFAYSEDSDYLYRLGLAGLPSPRENGGEWPQFMVDATSYGDALTLTRRMIDADVYQRSLATYAKKWGGPQGSELWQRPYNDPRLDFRFTGGHTHRAVRRFARTP